ncbi:YceI family protein [Coralliovum pocilloporae]|uniref:YceI family protein n=1 Tax=Coralliovum pocilloporae TaxID=3066369 RepID=UPI0033076FC4
MKTMLKTLALATALTFPFAAQAATWSVDSEQSVVTFGSVKKTTTGEVHTFSAVSGKVDAKGNATLSVDVKSLETNIDIRNERMHKHVLHSEKHPAATFSGKLDLDELKDLKTGGIMTYDLEGTLTIAGNAVEVEAPVVVTRLADDKVMVVSDGFVVLDADEFGLTAGIEKLRELASLDSIDLAVPLSFRLVYNQMKY